MQFKVPQFIDIEDTLFGPLTFKQFAYLAGGGGVIFVIYKLLPLWIGIFFILPVGIITGLLTFYKINNKPFAYYLQAGITYLFTNKLYIWKQRLIKPTDKKEEEKKISAPLVPMISQSKLSDLAWGLDMPTEETQEKEKTAGERYKI